MNHPSIEAILSPGSPGSRFNQRLDQIEQGQVHVGEVGYFGRPIVHLYIDICVIITIPGCLDFIGPDALQVSR